MRWLNGSVDLRTPWSTRRVAAFVAVAVVAVTAAVYVVQIGRDRPRGGSTSATPTPTPTPTVERKETPGDGAALARICDGGAGFSGAAPYRGAGPHPTAVILGFNVLWFRPDSQPGPSDLKTAQLVACLELGGPGSRSPLTTCRYRNGLTATLLRGLHRLDIHAVDSGRLIDTVTVDGSAEPVCPTAVMVTRGTTSTSEITRPGDAEYTAALRRWADGPAIG